MGRSEALKGPAILDLTQPTAFVTQDRFFALGMGCPSPNIAVKFPVLRHPLPYRPSRSSKEYEAKRYHLLEDVLLADVVDELCALDLEGEENWEDILLHSHNQRGGRRQTAVGTVNKWLPPGTQVAFAAHFGRPFPSARRRGGQGAPVGGSEGGTPMEGLPMAPP